MKIKMICSYPGSFLTSKLESGAQSFKLYEMLMYYLQINSLPSLLWVNRVFVNLAHTDMWFRLKGTGNLAGHYELDKNLS